MSILRCEIFDDWIRQATNTSNCDGDFVAVFQGKVVIRNDPGAGHQERTVREFVIPEQSRDQLFRRAFHLAQSGAVF